METFYAPRALLMRWLVSTLLICFAILGAAQIVRSGLADTAPVAQAGPFNPFRPRPDPKPPAPSPPLSEDDGRLFARLLPRIREVAEERAAERVAREFQSAAAELSKGPDAVAVIDFTNVDGEVVSPTQGILGVILASAIASFVKKLIVAALASMVTVAVVALLYQWWAWLVPGFIGGVTVVAWPAGWAAAKFAKSKE